MLEKTVKCPICGEPLKRLLIVIVLTLLPFKVALRAQDSFPYNPNEITEWLCDCIPRCKTEVCRLAPEHLKHDTTREYLKIDTINVPYNIECDTTWETWTYFDSIYWTDSLIDTTEDKRYEYLRLKSLSCDTIFRVEYREVWERMLPVYLPPDQWRYLMEWLSERTDPNPDTLR